MLKVNISKNLLKTIVGQYVGRYVPHIENLLPTNVF